MPGIQDLKEILSSLDPELDDRIYTFVSEKILPTPTLETLIGQFQEKEGITLICESEEAVKRGLYHHGNYKKISLRVHSSLDAVGLTAAVSKILSEAAIPCNVVAGFFHDHIFVPTKLAKNAMTILHSLKDSSKS